MARKWELISKDPDYLKELGERSITINEGVVDITKHISKTGKSDTSGDKEKEYKEDPSGTKPAPAPTPPPAPPAGPKPGTTPPPTTPTPSAPPPTTGGHSTKSSRVRGIENKLDFDKLGAGHKLTEMTTWLRSGGYPKSRAELISTKKWIQFQDIYGKIRRSIEALNSEEIQDIERFNLLGTHVNIGDYANGKEKYFDKVTVPDKDLAEINIIIALDASGSTGSRRQYNMSGATLAAVKALEETKTRHSVMIYDHNIAILTVDQVGRTSVTNVLGGDMTGGGGNTEAIPLAAGYEIVKTNKDIKNVMILISDGGVADVRDITAKMAKGTNALNVYCLGYGADFDTEYAKKIFGNDKAMGAKDNAQFAKLFEKIIVGELAKTRLGLD